MTPSKKPHVVVIGAGIIGLQSAVFLLEAGYTVTIIAKHIPGDASIEYTSPWAGAQWRTHASASNPELCAWDIETYEHWHAVLAAEQRANTPPAQCSGLALYTSHLYWDDPAHPELAHGPAAQWWAPRVRDFRVLAPSELPQGVVAGVSFTSFTIDVTRNLPYLLARVQGQGGVVVRAALTTGEGLGAALQEAEKRVGGDVDVFLNATGIGAGTLIGDQGVFPVRGQVVLARGGAKRISTRQGVDPETGEAYIAYALPRADGKTTVLGGCKQKGNWEASVDEAMTEKIFERCKELCPELLNEEGKFEHVGVQVGLRPGRKDGVRVEREIVKDGGKDWEVVHAYGHDGAGYQNSVGCARKVVRLVTEALG